MAAGAVRWPLSVARLCTLLHEGAPWPPVGCQPRAKPPSPFPWVPSLPHTRSDGRCSSCTLCTPLHKSPRCPPVHRQPRARPPTPLPAAPSLPLTRSGVHQPLHKSTLLCTTNPPIYLRRPPALARFCTRDPMASPDPFDAPTRSRSHSCACQPLHTFAHPCTSAPTALPCPVSPVQTPPRPFPVSSLHFSTTLVPTYPCTPLHALAQEPPQPFPALQPRHGRRRRRHLSERGSGAALRCAPPPAPAPQPQPPPDTGREGAAAQPNLTHSAAR